MDIQKDKDFTSLPEIAKLYQACKERDLTIAEREYLKGARDAWQAAKAHEAEKLKGCVLVPVQCPDPDFADSLFDELSKKAIGEFGDDLLIHFSDIDEEKIWALMVEAAKAQAVPEGRTDFEIINQTIELVDLLALSTNVFQRDPKSKVHPFESLNPRVMEWWRTACQIQELLTNTDPDNCDFEEYKAMIEAQEPTND